MQQSVHTLWHNVHGTGAKSQSDALPGWVRLTLPLGTSMVLWYGIWLIVRTQL